MLSYCLKGKNTKSKNPKTKNRRIMLLSKCEMCDSKKLKLIKEQDISGYLSLLEINPTGTLRRIRVDATSILRRYVEGQISTNFDVISTNFFYVISPIKKSTSSLRTLFNVISMVEKFMLFPRTFFDVILMVKKFTLFPRTLFWCNFTGRKIHVVSMYFS